MKKIELKGQKAVYLRAIEILNGNLSELENELAKVPEIEKVTLELVHRFNNGLTLKDLFNELANEYIEQFRPRLLANMQELVKTDFVNRLPSDKNVYERISMFKNMLGWFESQTGETADIVRIGSKWQVSAAQQKRLMESCTVALSAKQATYLSLLDEVMKAKKKLADWEQENGIHNNIGIQYMSNPDTVYGLIRAI